MKLTTTAAIGFTLLCSVSAPALAQSSQDSCARLQQVTEQNRNRFNGEWIRQAEQVIRARDEQTCQRYAEQGEGAAKQLDQQASSGGQQGGTSETQNSQTQSQQTSQSAQGEASGGQIMVTQPQPQVTVQQQPPQIDVIQPQPQVSVNQQQPQILVRQAPPTVHVQMPQPVITIDQPEPEIIVRMPPPEVAVNTPQPQVQVSQAQPQVQVKQPQPQVQVQMEQPQVNVQENKQAEVKVQRAQPEVQLQQQGKPEVKVTQAKPQVSYEAAQPKVEVEQAGQPKVEFRQSGQAQVKVEQMQAQAEQQQATSQQKTNSQQQASTEDQPTGSTSRAALTEQDRERIGVIDANQQKLKPAEVKASQLINKPVVNQKGEKLGTIKAISREGNVDFAVIDHGGALSLSQREIMVPAQRIAVDGKGRIVLLGLTEQDFTALPKLQADAGQAIKPNETVRVSKSQQ